MNFILFTINSHEYEIIIVYIKGFDIYINKNKEEV